MSALAEEKDSTIMSITRRYDKIIESKESIHQGELRKIMKLICKLEDEVSFCKAKVKGSISFRVIIHRLQDSWCI